MDYVNTMKNSYLTEIKTYKNRLRTVLQAARICVFEVDVINQLYTFFENAEAIFGVSGDIILADVQPYSKLPPDEYQEAVSQYFSHPDDAAVIDRAFQSIFNGEHTTYEARMRAGGSHFIWCRLDVTPIIENGVPSKMIGVITDISDIKEKNDDLERAVSLESFTGLLNKSYAIERIRKVLHRSPDRTHALILIDIDNFKPYNDTYGHASGDRVIKMVADSLRNSFRETDIIGRFGGDEFILFLENVPDINWLEERLQTLLRYERNDCRCTCSAGVALFPHNACGFDQLFEQADKALYQSKLIHETYTFFSE